MESIRQREVSAVQSSLSEWLRNHRNARLQSKYKAESKFIWSQMNLLNLAPKNGQKCTEKNLFEFSGNRLTYPKRLDDVVNTILLYYTWKGYLQDDELGKIKIGELPARFKRHNKEIAEPVAVLKYRLIEPILFIEYLRHCLDKDPLDFCDPDFESYAALPKVFELAIESATGISETKLQNLLAGIALFLNTPLNKIQCMTREEAILLKNSAYCWVFLALFLAGTELPIKSRMSDLLAATDRTQGEKTYPAIYKILKLLSTAMYSCIGFCGGDELSREFKEDSGLMQNIDQDYLSKVRDDFIQAAILTKPNHRLTKVLSKRDPGKTAYNRKYKVSDDPEWYNSKVAKNITSRIFPRSGQIIRKEFPHLDLFQKILSSLQLSTQSRDTYEVNKTLNFILFEYITDITTFVIHSLGLCNSTNSFFFIPVIDKEPNGPEEYRKPNPFYNLSKNQWFESRFNDLTFDWDDCVFLQIIRKLLLKNMEFSNELKLEQVDPLRNYLYGLFHISELHSVFHDRERCGTDRLWNFMIKPACQKYMPQLGFFELRRLSNYISIPVKTRWHKRRKHNRK